VAAIRRTHAFLPIKSKKFEPRQLHGTQLGAVCPAETPDNENIGYTKQMTVLVELTLPGKADWWSARIAALPAGEHLVLLNGRIAGRVRDLGESYRLLRAQIIQDPPYQTGVTIQDNAVCVDTSPGRYTRLLVKVPLVPALRRDYFDVLLERKVIRVHSKPFIGSMYQSPTEHIEWLDAKLLAPHSRADLLRTMIQDGVLE